LKGSEQKEAEEQRIHLPASAPKPIHPRETHDPVLSSSD
jgi:hypothetical protein